MCIRDRYYPVLMEIIQDSEDEASLKEALKLRKNELSPKHLSLIHI